MAHAEKSRPRAHRFHLGTQALLKRLAPATQQNARAVGQYMIGAGRSSAPEGTAFIVASDAVRGRALALTAAHVTLYRDRAKQQVDFYPQGADKPKVSAQVKRLVARNLRYDYTLVELELPPSMRDVRPIHLSAAPLATDMSVYAVGYPDLWTMHDWAISRKQGKRTLERPRFATILATGEVHRPETRLTRLDVHDPRRPQWMSGGGAHFSTEGFSANVPTFRGSSGGPLFAKDGHGFVGLLNALDLKTLGMDKESNSYHWGIMAVPASRIVASLRHMLSAEGKTALLTGEVAPPKEMEA
ncbi:MAG: trypsin-like peptidase domain-containing protein [Deltaproteobacteria bacterium]|nr:trypsin-like peptidase domain-containing protein [Deltaproteobacteria bacterium]